MMSVVYKSQCHARCDKCGDWEARCINLTLFKKMLRKAGWSIGKVTLCPECSGKRIHIGAPANENRSN